ncbi:hypothetical protein BKA57DRAFT_38681 [Linnemannia elongata]|nr:hypothetical protein BKA57DRAFT_38681 [Linnemannia elongata]
MTGRHDGISIMRLALVRFSIYLSLLRWYPCPSSLGRLSFLLCSVVHFQFVYHCNYPSIHWCVSLLLLCLRLSIYFSLPHWPLYFFIFHYFHRHIFISLAYFVHSLLDARN